MHILADILVLLHLLFVVFAVLGALICLRYRWVMVLHLPAAVWACLIEFKGWICPLTYLENHLRQQAGATGYTGGFVENYLVPILYPPGLTTKMQVLLGFTVLFINLVIYSFLVTRWWVGHQRAKVVI
jgi:hypothetical protein